MENRQEFIQALHDLLTKYNMEISIAIDGDTHGVSTWLTIDHRPNPKSCKHVEILRLDELTPYDLKPFLPFIPLDLTEFTE